ncbi:ABC transporter family substrate-binding protein [Streptomyces iconiensis]|uniref:ABC transporter family substrate-binding protein n=1 Tax=Streptomyces iconiensis TaxID=1384038 RepID=A0ABT7AA37_9ACTN|nr:ABC transporter family substrate-binding protein [Streptomyces iconiensis]MDJ1138201.1 ABC transporter family substrate-binding protein [Streptomyces iconiensis]
MRAVPAESAAPAESARPAASAWWSLSGAAARRCAAALTVGVLLPLPLAASGSASGDSGGGAQHDATGDVRPAERNQVSSGGTLRWAVDAAPTTLNTFQPDAGEATERVAEATLPSLFTLDKQGAPQLNQDYLRGAEITETEPRQTVVYKLGPKARWSDGRRVGPADFRAQWKALRGKNSAYWTARNAGYERISKITRGEGPREVKVVFAKPYADWRSLFTPLYPKQVMSSPDAFNDGARTRLPASAGPFRVAKIDKKSGTTTLERDPHWRGERAKLKRIQLKAVPRDERAAALAKGKLDLADVDPSAVKKATSGKKAEKKSWEHFGRKVAAKEEGQDAVKKGYGVRKALDPAYTQLTLNGSSGPLADERVRRAVAGALDRGELAKQALDSTGLPAEPLGNHLRMAGQDGYKDNSGAVGGGDVDAAQSLLADADWKSGGAFAQPGPARPGHKGQKDEREAKGEKSGERGKREAGSERRAHGGPEEPPRKGHSPDAGARAPHRVEAEAAVVPLTPAQIARVTDKPLSLTASAGVQRGALLAQAAHLEIAEARENDSRSELRQARAALAVAEEVRAKAGELRLLSGGTATPVRSKNGKPLALRFVLPGGPGSESLRATGERIAEMLNGVGIRTQIKEVPNASYFKDHVAAGEYDLALYSWPASAYPATDGRPIFAKPSPAADGSLLVEQNYARVGTDQIDQLFEQAAGELDDGRRGELVEKADARIWAVAGSLPLYQRPQTVVAKNSLANAGAFGFATPRYQDIGFQKS